jgi:hypothetical protein
LDRRHAQSGVFVLVASVTGVLGAGKEVAVDLALDDGADEAGVVVVVNMGDGAGNTRRDNPSGANRGAGGRVTDTRGVVTFVPAFGFGVATLVRVGFAEKVPVVIRRSKGDSALFAAAGEPVLLMTEATGDLDLPSVLP